jgi:5-methylcytosine-specific restriction protein A
MAKWAVCTQPGCAVLHQGKGKCPTHVAQTRATADQARRPQGNPYNSAGHRRFRAVVLARDPICVICGLAASTIADHHPTERRDLLAAGLDPNDPARGRGLCATCHNKHTARSTPGGWNWRNK